MKYKILKNESIKHEGKTLYRIQALKDFGNVKTGDLGGYVESESNLSQEGNCWVYDNVKVFDDAKVFGNTEVCGDDNLAFRTEEGGIWENYIGEKMKYKILFNESIEHNGKTLYRIQALKDFGNVKTGDLGGYVESESNLSQEGNCWVFNNSKVFGNVQLSDNAQVFGDAEVGGNTKLYKYIKSKTSIIKDMKKYKILENESIEHNGKTLYRIQALKDFGTVKTGDIGGYIESEHNLLQEGNCWVFDNSKVFGNVQLSDNAMVFGDTEVFCIARLGGNQYSFYII